MNTIANYITISALPYYCKSVSFRHVLPQLDCHWSSDRCAYPFILSATGAIATAETFPFNRKDYRRTGNLFTFTRRWTPRGLHQLSYTFEILEKVATGEKFAIIRDVVRGGRVY